MVQAAIDEAPLKQVLAREHERAKADEAKMAAIRPEMAAAKARGAATAEINRLYPDDVYLAIEPDMGRFLYLAALSVNARAIVEFGTSHGVSTLYLAAAARETGGRVITSELAARKIAHARSNLEEADLDRWADLRQGDALVTLQDVEAPIEFLFLDGWKDLYVPVLELLEPKLATGALVLADNIFTFPDELKRYVEMVSAPDGPYRSVVLPFTSGISYAVYGDKAAGR